MSAPRIASQIALLPLALAAGVALGLLYFGLLRRSVRALAAGGGPRPGRWLLGAAGRLALALAGFGLLVALGGAPAGLAALLGFVLGRVAVTRAPFPGERRGGEARPWN